MAALPDSTTESEEAPGGCRQVRQDGGRVCRPLSGRMNRRLLQHLNRLAQQHAFCRGTGCNAYLAFLEGSSSPNSHRRHCLQYNLEERKMQKWAYDRLQWWLSTDEGWAYEDMMLEDGLVKMNPFLFFRDLTTMVEWCLEEWMKDEHTLFRPDWETVLNPCTSSGEDSSSGADSDTSEGNKEEASGTRKTPAGKTATDAMSRGDEELKSGARTASPAKVVDAMGAIQGRENMMRAADCCWKYTKEGRVALMILPAPCDVGRIAAMMSDAGISLARQPHGDQPGPLLLQSPPKWEKIWIRSMSLAPPDGHMPVSWSTDDGWARTVPRLSLQGRQGAVPPPKATETAFAYKRPSSWTRDGKDILVTLQDVTVRVMPDRSALVTNPATIGINIDTTKVELRLIASEVKSGPVLQPLTGRKPDMMVTAREAPHSEGDPLQEATDCTENVPEETTGRLVDQLGAVIRSAQLSASRGQGNTTPAMKRKAE